MSMILLMASLFAALTYGIWYCHQPASWAKTVVKTATVAALALWVWALGGPWLLIVGLVLSAAGDFFLSREGDHTFLAGLVSFALAHIGYVALFSGYASGMPPVIPMMLVGAFAVSTEIWLAPHTGDLRWPVRGYVVLIVGMAIAALSLPTDLIAVKLGALAFLASDTLLAIQLFRLPSGAAVHRVFSLLLWGLYCGAQGLIAWGIVAQGF